MDALNIRHCRLLRAEALANPIAKRGWGGPGALGLPEKGGGGRGEVQTGAQGPPSPDPWICTMPKRYPLRSVSLFHGPWYDMAP